MSAEGRSGPKPRLTLPKLTGDLIEHEIDGSPSEKA